MRILLVNPPASTIFARLGMSLPPLGLLYIAAVLEAEGHQVQLEDFSVHGDPKSFSWDPYDLVGITTDTSRVRHALAIASKARRSGARVVLGGPHAQYCAEEILATGDVDFIVHGEGEETMAELLRALAAGGDPREVRGLSFPLGENGRPAVGRSDPRPPIADLSQLPFPARHLIRPEAYLRARVHGRPPATISTSRGCPSDCKFCSVPDFAGRKLRFRSLENVMEEIELIYHRLGYRALAFVDDNFTVNPRRATAIADEIIRRGYDFHLWMFSRPDTIVRNPEMVSRLAEAGTKTIFVGIESGSDETLRAFNKRYTADTARQAVRLLRDNGIETLGAYILGALEDTRKSITAQLRFARELDTETAQFSILTPFPGTGLFEELEGRLTTRNWSRYDGMRLVFRHPGGFRGNSLELWLLWANISFYFRSLESIGRLFRFWRSRSGGAVAAQRLGVEKRSP